MRAKTQQGKLASPKLFDVDYEVLDLLQDGEFASITDLTKALGLRYHTLRRSIERLRAHNAIVPYTPINTAALGLFEHHILLTGGGLFTSTMRNILRSLVLHDLIPFVSELAGQIQFSVWVQNSRHLQVVLDSLLRDLPQNVQKLTLFRRYYHALGISFGRRRSTIEYLLAGTDIPVSIDELDHKILRNISSQNLTSLARLSRELRIPSSTLDYRIDRLKKLGVLLEQRFRVIEPKVGLHAFVFRIKVISASRVRDKLLSIVRQNPEIGSLSEFGGAWDFEMRVAAKSFSETNRIVGEIGSCLGGDCVDIEITPHVRYLKISNYPFVKPPLLAPRGPP